MLRTGICLCRWCGLRGLGVVDLSSESAGGWFCAGGVDAACPDGCGLVPGALNSGGLDGGRGRLLGVIEAADDGTAGVAFDTFGVAGRSDMIAVVVDEKEGERPMRTFQASFYGYVLELFLIASTDC